LMGSGKSSSKTTGDDLMSDAMQTNATTKERAMARPRTRLPSMTPCIVEPEGEDEQLSYSDSGLVGLVLWSNLLKYKKV
jgi:hypothetical protein